MQEKSNSEMINKTGTEQTAAGTGSDVPETDGSSEAGLEELFAQAESLIRRLEEPGLALEEAFEAYEQGMRIIRQCNRKIDLVEEKMMVMNEEGALVPFETL